MKLSKDAFKAGIKNLVMAFPNWRLDKNDPEVMKFWYERFQKLSNEEFISMVAAYIKKEEMPPTVAGLYKKHNSSPYIPASEIAEERRRRNA